jgi:hypothetical protein
MSQDYYQGQERTTPYGSPATGRVFLHQFKHGSSGRLTIFAAIAGLLGIAVSAASMALFLTYKSSAETQIRQLQQAVYNAQADNQSNASSLSSQAGKLSSINAALSAIAQFSKVCSQDLTGPNGPAQFFFQCTDTKPGG